MVSGQCRGRYFKLDVLLFMLSESSDVSSKVWLNAVSVIIIKLLKKYLSLLENGLLSIVKTSLPAWKVYVLDNSIVRTIIPSPKHESLPRFSDFGHVTIFCYWNGPHTSLPRNKILHKNQLQESAFVYNINSVCV